MGPVLVRPGTRMAGGSRAERESIHPARVFAGRGDRNGGFRSQNRGPHASVVELAPQIRIAPIEMLTGSAEFQVSPGSDLHPPHQASVSDCEPDGGFRL